MELCVSFSSILLAFEDEANLAKNKAALEEIIQVRFSQQNSLIFVDLCLKNLM